MRRALILAAVAALLAVAGGGSRGSAATPPEPSQVHGVNFLVKSQIDTSFCMQVATGTQEGRLVTLQTCSNADSQRWGFTWNDDDSNFIVEEQVGMCLDGHAPKGSEGLALPVARCQTGAAWRFVFTSAGLIESVRNGKCLSVAGAASNANVSLADCDATRQGQLWTIGH